MAKTDATDQASSGAHKATRASVIAEGPALSPEDVADGIAALEATYASPREASAGSVVVVGGAGVKVAIHDGHLSVQDGEGWLRRDRRYNRAAEPPDRVVVLADSGYVSLAALHWLHKVKASFVVLDPDGVTLAMSPAGKGDARLRRAQALAPEQPVGLEVAKMLLGAKLAGQVSVLRGRLDEPIAVDTIEAIAAALEVASDIDEARQLEATAAACYWGAWNGHPAAVPRFRRADVARGRIPEHWQRFDGRRSVLSAGNSNRKAERPVNVLLNYCFALAAIEARIACQVVGLDPGLGIIHLDAAGRDSMALDVIEPVRPVVERFVLDLLAERTFSRADFAEAADGGVRVMAPLTHELAGAMPAWAKALAPYAEKAAHLLGEAVAGKFQPRTPLSGAKAKAAQAAVKVRKARSEHARRLQVGQQSRPLSDPARLAIGFATCVDCGGALERTRHVRCAACWEHQPAQSRDVRRRRGRAIASARGELERWRAEHPHATARPEDFSAVQAGLARVTLRAIMDACAVSKATASGWRSGRHVPALRHWPALADLAGVLVSRAGGRSSAAG